MLGFSFILNHYLKKEINAFRERSTRLKMAATNDEKLELINVSKPDLYNKEAALESYKELNSKDDMEYLDDSQKDSFLWTIFGDLVQDDVTLKQERGCKMYLLGTILCGVMAICEAISMMTVQVSYNLFIFKMFSTLDSMLLLSFTSFSVPIYKFFTI